MEYIPQNEAIRKAYNLMSDGRVDDALALLSKVDQGDESEIADYYIGLIYSGAHVGQKDLERAEYHLRSASEVGVVDARIVLAKLYWGQGKLDAAINEISRIKDCSPECAYLYFRMITANGNESADAASYLSKAVRERYASALEYMWRDLKKKGILSKLKSFYYFILYFFYFFKEYIKQHRDKEFRFD